MRCNRCAWLTLVGVGLLSACGDEARFHEIDYLAEEAAQLEDPGPAVPIIHVMRRTQHDDAWMIDTTDGAGCERTIEVRLPSQATVVSRSAGCPVPRAQH